MCKLIASVNVTLDGFMAAADGSLDWHFPYWDNEAGEVLARRLSTAGALLLGRNTYQAMAAFWPYRAMDASCPREDHALAAVMNSLQKIVVSTTLQTAGWNNTIIINNLDALPKLKAAAGKDMVLLGSHKLMAALQHAQLVDEYHIWLHPIAIGAGISLFNPVTELELRLYHHKSFSNGLVRLIYRL